MGTTVTRTLGIEVPIVQAGMAYGFTDAGLVSAVSEAGGLGVLGCLNRTLEDAIAEIERIRARTSKPFGVNFVVQHMDWPVFTACLTARVPVFTFFRGDPVLVVDRAHAVGGAVIYQITTVEEAVAAVRAGADVLVAQGVESGGHVGPIPLADLLPKVVAVAGGRPVLAAGGIVDGQSLADAMSLGAKGGWMGTRFLATPESPALPAHKRAILDAQDGATVRTGMLDRVWGRPWPGVEVRTIRNALTDRWIGREEEIEAVRHEIERGIEVAKARDDGSEMDLLAGEGVGRISSIVPAADLVRQIAEHALP